MAAEHDCPERILVWVKSNTQLIWTYDGTIDIICSIGTKSVSPTVVEVMGPKYLGAMTFTFLGHVTSSFM